jgi:membrane associated rhomboid family serine protease
MLFMFLSTTLLIIIATAILSFKGFKDPKMSSDWALSPYSIKHYHTYSRLFLHMFIHADLPHLLFNMLSFYMFGEMLENQFISIYGGVLGEIYFVILYFIGGLFATTWPYFRNYDNPNYISVGASGAVSAIIFSAILWNPTMTVGLIFLPIPIPAYIFGPLYLGFEYWAFKRNKTNIAHDAHLGGALFGILFTLLVNSVKGKEFIDLIF